jgi:hypothetical protein
MSGSGAVVAADLVGLLAASEMPVAAVGPGAVLDVPWPVRGVATFLLVAGLGGVLLRRREGFVDRSVDAATSHPVSALGHGVAAHAVIAFVGVYMANKFARYVPMDGTGPLIGLSFGFLLVLVAGVVGFTVVGAIVVDLGGDPQRWHGVVLGAAVAAVAAAVASTAGAVCWFVVVSMGIGGAVRRWLQASAMDDF